MDCFEGGGLAPHQAVLDVATALTTSNVTEAVALAEKHGASYVFIALDDAVKAWMFFNVSGLDPAEYVVDGVFTEAGEQSLIYRLLYGDPASFELVYGDEAAKVYKVPELSEVLSQEVSEEAFPVYPGSMEQAVPAELKTNLGIVEGLNCVSYAVDAGFDAVVEWFKSNMEDWSLEDESFFTPGDQPSVTVALQFYRRGR